MKTNKNRTKLFTYSPAQHVAQSLPWKYLTPKLHNIIRLPMLTNFIG